MKAKELIKRLNKYVKKHPNAIVCIYNSEFDSHIPVQFTSEGLSKERITLEAEV